MGSANIGRTYIGSFSGPSTRKQSRETTLGEREREKKRGRVRDGKERERESNTVTVNLSVTWFNYIKQLN